MAVNCLHINSQQAHRTPFFPVLFALFIFALLIFTSSKTFSYDEGGDVTDAANYFDDDNLLIVEIILGKYRLASDVFIYSSPEATFVPLQPIFDAIEFPIEVDPVALKATGWFLRESNRFDLNVKNRSLILDGEVQEIPHSARILSDGYDVYVDIVLLKQWFPFDVELQTGRLRLVIHSQQPLPIEKQLEREKNRKHNLGRVGAERLPIVEDNYRKLGVPVIDVTLGADVSDAETSSKEIEADASYSIQASMDLLNMQSSLSLSKASRNADANRRFTLYKKPNHLEENMLGELAYTSIGDVFGVSDGLVFSGGDGLGAEFQFGDVRTSSDFGKRDIEGDATPGWEVELYRNNVLVDFKQVGDDGRYRFEDVSVEYGENIFDIRLYGPQGQERFVRESIQVGEQALPQGEFYSQMSYINLNQSVFGDDNNENTNILSAADEEKSQFLMQYGLTQWLSAGFSYSYHENAFQRGEDNHYIQLGFSGALPFATWAYEQAKIVDGGQYDGGKASSLSVQSRLGDTAISYAQKSYRDFVSERNTSGLIEDEIELRLTGVKTLFGLNPISYQLIGDYQSNQNGSYSYAVENRLGFQFLRGRMTLDTILNEGSTQQKNIAGRARYLRVVGPKSSIRAALDYSIDPTLTATGATTSITWRPKDRMRTQLSVNSDFVGNDNNSLGLSFSYLFDHFALSTDAFFLEGGGSSLLLTAEFSLSRVEHKKWRLSNEYQSPFGRARALVFLDKDQNGVFSAGDEPLEGVRFEGRNAWQELATNERGEVFLPGLRSEFPSRIELDKGSLVDPYWRSTFDKNHFVSHGGGLHELHVPIVETAEVEGSILLLKNDQVRPLAGMPVYVEDLQGQVVSTVVSEFDGFFVFEGVFPGQYQLRLDESALERFSVAPFETVPFSVEQGVGVLYLDSIILRTRVDEDGVETVDMIAQEDGVYKTEQGYAEVVFRVQVAAYVGEASKRYSEIPDVERFVGEDGLTRYVSREYRRYQDAQSRLNELLAQGYDDAFITAYLKEKRVQPKINTSGSVTASLQLSEPVRALSVASASNLYYVQVAAYAGELPARFAQIDDLQILGDELINGEASVIRYVTQGYANYSDALARKQALNKAGFKGVFIVRNAVEPVAEAIAVPGVSAGLLDEQESNEQVGAIEPELLAVELASEEREVEPQFDEDKPVISAQAASQSSAGEAGFIRIGTAIAAGLILMLLMAYWLNRKNR